MSETKYLSKKECISQLAQQIAGEIENETLNDTLNTQIHPDIDDDMLISDGNVDVDTLKEYNKFVFIHNDYGENEVLSIVPRKPADEFITEIHLHDGFKQYDMPPSQFEKLFKNMTINSVHLKESQNIMDILQMFVNTENDYYRDYAMFPTITMEIFSNDYKINGNTNDSETPLELLADEERILPNFKHKETVYNGYNDKIELGNFLKYPNKSENDIVFTIKEKLTWTVKIPIPDYKKSGVIFNGNPILSFSNEFLTKLRNLGYNFITIDDTYKTVIFEREFNYKIENNTWELYDIDEDFPESIEVKLITNECIFQADGVICNSNNNKSLDIIFPFPFPGNEDQRINITTTDRVHVNVVAGGNYESSIATTNFSISVYHGQYVQIRLSHYSGSTVNNSLIRTIISINYPYINYIFDLNTNYEQITFLVPTFDFKVIGGEQSTYKYKRGETWEQWVNSENNIYDEYYLNTLGGVTYIYTFGTHPIKGVVSTDKIIRNAEYSLGR